MINNKTEILLGEMEDPTGLSASGDPAQAPEQTLTGSVGGCADSGEAVGLHKKNRSRAAKRKARRTRELAPTGTPSEPPLTPLTAAREGLVAKKKPARLCGDVSLGAEKRQEA